MRPKKQKLPKKSSKPISKPFIGVMVAIGLFAVSFFTYAQSQLVFPATSPGTPTLITDVNTTKTRVTALESINTCRRQADGTLKDATGATCSFDPTNLNGRLTIAENAIRGLYELMASIFGIDFTCSDTDLSECVRNFYNALFQEICSRTPEPTICALCDGNEDIGQCFSSNFFTQNFQNILNQLFENTTANNYFEEVFQTLVQNITEQITQEITQNINNYTTLLENIANNNTFVTELTQNQTFLTEVTQEITNNTSVFNDFITQLTQNQTFLTEVTNNISNNLNLTVEFAGTGTSANGARGGYASANALCPANSHVCSDKEILNLVNQSGTPFGTATGAAWINTASVSNVDNFIANDCNGWNSGSVSYLGTYWDFGAKSSYLLYCNESLPFACCR